MKKTKAIQLLIGGMIIFALLTGCAKNIQSNPVQKSSTKTIVDMAGRKLTIPTEIKKAYSTSQIGMIMIYTLNPDKLAGWAFKLTPEEKKYIPEKYYNLPLLGAWSGKKGTANIEEIVKVHPEVLISMGDIDKGNISTADSIQEKTGIPVVMVDGSLDKLNKAYDFIGNLIGEEEKAKVLGEYCSNTISEVKSKIDKIPENKQVRVYYAEGLKGLETDPKGSFHTEVLDFVGGINVAEVPVKKGYGRAQVSIEQIMTWNPDVIIAGYDKEIGGGFYSQVFDDQLWKDVKAVKEKRVYQIPVYPYDWFDRPPSVNRIIGVKWLANLLYPEYVPLDIEAEVTEFYDLFYHKKLTKQQVKEVLKNAVVE